MRLFALNPSHMQNGYPKTLNLQRASERILEVENGLTSH